MKRFNPGEATRLTGKKVRWVDIDNPDKEWFEATVQSVNQFSMEICFLGDPVPRSLLSIKMEAIK